MGQSVRQRIKAGNRAYYAHLRLFKNQIVSGSTNFEVYRTLVRPDVTNGAVIWLLRVADEYVHRSFERRIIRKIFGPVRYRGEWRLR
jgi:hypothetical protein